MRKLIIFTLATFACYSTMAQTSQWGTPTGNVQFPKNNYTELPDPKVADSAALASWAKVKGTQASWGNSDVRYDKNAAPAITRAVLGQSLTAWRGEQLGAQAVVWSATTIDELNFELSPLVSTKNAQDTIKGSAAFVRYVMQDNFFTCGYREKIAKWDSSLVADPIDHLAKSLKIEAHTTRPLWVKVQVPQTATQGDYKGSLTIKNGEQVIATLTLTIHVLDRALPDVKEWAFHLDMWQNPYAEARYQGVVPFSDEHFAAMRPGLELLRAAGQKVITTSIMHKPWGGQTEDYFESMVSWIRRGDGTWAFDFTTFDRWVEYMQSLGFDGQIACYTMIPWNMSFKYYDQVTNSMQTLRAATSDKAYAEVWTALLKSLSAHLRERGWFDRAVISMDERDTKAMMDAFAIIKAADPAFKVSLAGGNHPEIEAELYDYSMASDNLFTPEVLAKRRAKGQISTFYTCCAQKFPNLFTYSPAAQIEWIGWFAAAKNYDGYLRWAFNSYTKEPLLDARFRAFQSGDCYMIYPGGRSSIRWEKMIDGVEVFEKIRILRAEFEAKKDIRSLARLDKLLAEFDLAKLEKNIDPSVMVDRARVELNKM
ncbi:MAG: DUF6067 family protein [Mucinivorans sp.]